MNQRPILVISKKKISPLFYLQILCLFSIVFFILSTHILHRKENEKKENHVMILKKKEIHQLNKTLGYYCPPHLQPLYPWSAEKNSQKSHGEKSQKEKNLQIKNIKNINNNIINNNTDKNFFSSPVLPETLRQSSLWNTFPQPSKKLLGGKATDYKTQKILWESWIKKALSHCSLISSFLRVYPSRAIITKNLLFQSITFSLGFLTKNDDNFWLFFYYLLHRFPGIILPKNIQLNPSVFNNSLTLRGSLTCQCYIVSCIS